MDEQLIQASAPELENFSKLSNRGKNGWKRYLAAIFIILFTWQLIGSLPALIVFLLRLETNPIWFFLGVMVSFWFFVLGLFLAVRFVHGRPFRTLITPRRSVSWMRIFQGFGLWLMLTTLTTAVDYLIRPEFYRVNFQPVMFLIFLPLALVLAPIQTSAEELFFRGYIIQWLGRRINPKVVLVILSGVLFAVPHFLNPEMSSGFALAAAYYFLMGAFLAWITLLDNRLELALGIHAANNLFAFLLVNYEGSVIMTPSLFLASGIDPVANLLTFILQACLVLAVFFLPKGSQSREGNVG